MKQLHITYTRMLLNNNEHSISFIAVRKDIDNLFFTVHANDQFLIKSHEKDKAAEDEIKKRLLNGDPYVLNIHKQRPFTL